jgi:hypothetical protein
MRFRDLTLGIAIAALSVHLGWAQLMTEVVVQPSLDPAQIDAPFVPGELVVGLEEGDFALPLLAMEMVGTITAQNPPIRSFVVKLAPNLTMQDAGEFLRALPGVRYVEPNYLAFAFATPNDPYFSQQYGPQRIQANLAWDIWAAPAHGLHRHHRHGHRLEPPRPDQQDASACERRSVRLQHAKQHHERAGR